MIRAYFGLKRSPFDREKVKLLPHQEDIFHILNVHSQQGGLCLVLGQPGTGKSVIKEAIKNKQKEDKRFICACVGRTLHTYWNTIQILCEAFEIEPEKSAFKSERKLIAEVYTLFREGKSLITIIDEAHLMDMHTLRKLRLMFDDFPKNHNLILVGQPALLQKMSLKVHDDIKSRVTYSVIVQKLIPEDMEKFLISQFDRCGLGHHVFSPESIDLIIRSSDGLLRRCRNLSLSSMLEAVRHQSREITTDIVNQVLLQPHWRKEYDLVQD